MFSVPPHVPISASVKSISSFSKSREKKLLIYIFSLSFLYLIFTTINMFVPLNMKD